MRSFVTPVEPHSGEISSSNGVIIVLICNTLRAGAASYICTFEDRIFNSQRDITLNHNLIRSVFLQDLSTYKTV